MISLFLITTITCSQAFNIINRIKYNEVIPEYLKKELIEELKKTIPTCPIKIKKDE